jgi:UDP-N-acetylmuramoyl-L-alanyl-D-glutamate--2,6-diaminopimelate ligase
MNLMHLIEELPITGELSVDPEVTGITHDSRKVVAGDLFVAMVGERFDGRVFAQQAASQGAVAALGAGEAPVGLSIPWLRTESPREVLGPLAGRLFRHPDRELLTLGVTGTNGKSTTVALLGAILDAAGHPAGRIGTLGYRFGDLEFEGERTTPEASDLFRTLRRMRDAGADSVAMEVSSHALEMGRVAGMTYDVAIFTNLTRDHFDFHEGFEAYYAAKRRLFDQLGDTGRAVVNVDDPYGRRLARELAGALTYGRGGDVVALSEDYRTDGTRARFETPRGELEVRTRLLGRFNLENVTAAVAAGEALELPQEAIVEGLASLGPIPGRMEPIDAGQDFPVLIDYAHTDAALAAAVRSLKSFSEGKILLVFGCGGDRDPGKRVLMGRVAGDLADLPIVTSDNPRGEDPLTIITAVEEGLKQSGNDAYRVVPDRREAIRRAVAHAGPGWAVLVAGKGHEEVQLIGDSELPFSDREHLRQALEERSGARTGG